MLSKERIMEWAELSPEDRERTPLLVKPQPKEVPGSLWEGHLSSIRRGLPAAGVEPNDLVFEVVAPFYFQGDKIDELDHQPETAEDLIGIPSKAVVMILEKQRHAWSTADVRIPLLVLLSEEHNNSRDYELAAPIISKEHLFSLGIRRPDENKLPGFSVYNGDLVEFCGGSSHHPALLDVKDLGETNTEISL